MPRLPQTTQRDKNNEQAYDYLVKTRGAVRGGFAYMLSSPDVTQRIAHVGTYVRFDSPLPARIRELAATAISAELENPAEYVLHARQCRELGVPEAVVAAVIGRTPLAGASEEDKLIVDFTRELARAHKLSEATFQAAHQRLGDAGVTDLIAALGYYAMLAICHVALDVKPPAP